MIELDEVSCRAEANVLLHRVSLTANRGQLLAVVGPNGAGKSTLLRVMAGEYAPTSGEVRMGGRSLSTWSIRDRARVRAVASPTADIELPCSAARTVVLGRAPHHDGVETVRDGAIARLAMAATDMGSFEERRYASLSSGEKQRLRLARALAQIWEGPAGRALLLDDPLSGLDLSHQHDCLRLLRRMAAEGCAIVCVLHDLQLACRYADVVAVLHRGRLCAYGTPAAVFTQSLLADVFGMDASLAALPLPGLGAARPDAASILRATAAGGGSTRTSRSLS